MTIVVMLPCRTAAMSDQSPDEISKTILDLISQQNGKVGWHEIASALHADTHRVRATIYRELKRLEGRGVIRRELIEGVVRFSMVKPDGNGEKT
jgi:Fe2+ or Zn2+ uptake regulation protein